MARSISELAERAMVLYPPGVLNGSPVSSAAYCLRIEEAYRRLIHECPGIIRETFETPLTLSTRYFTLPADYRYTLPNGTYLSYTPRTIASISRTSDVLTVQTSTDHDLSVGMQVALNGVTGAGGTTFDGTVTVATVPDTTHFTAAQTADDDTGSGGSVEPTGTVWLTVKDEADLTLPPTSQETAGAPQYCFYTGAKTVGVNPISDGSYPALFVNYVAEAPVALVITDTLAVPDWCESALMAYAAARLNAIPREMGGMQAGLDEFAGAVRELRATLDDNINANDIKR